MAHPPPWFHPSTLSVGFFETPPVVLAQPQASVASHVPRQVMSPGTAVPIATSVTLPNEGADGQFIVSQFVVKYGDGDMVQLLVNPLGV